MNLQREEILCSKAKNWLGRTEMLAIHPLTLCLSSLAIPLTSISSSLKSGKSLTRIGSRKSYTSVNSVVLGLYECSERKGKPKG